MPTAEHDHRASGSSDHLNRTPSMTSTVSMPTPRLPNRAHAALLISSVWTAIAAVNGFQNILRAELWGWSVSIGWALTQNLIYLVIWAVATPLILATAHRFPIRRPKALVHSALHVLFGSCFVVLLNFLGLSFEAVTESRFELASVGLLTMQSVAHLYHAALIVYLIIVAVGHVHWSRLMSTRRQAQSKTNTQPPQTDDGQNNQTPNLNQIAVRKDRAIELLSADAVDWIEAAGDYVVLHAGRERHRLRESLGAIHQRLDPSRFVRIHRSAVVNVSRVTNVRPYNYGDLTLLLKTGRQLRVSRTRRRALEDALGIRR